MTTEKILDCSQLTSISTQRAFQYSLPINIGFFAILDQVKLDYHMFKVGLEFQLSEQVVKMESNLLLKQFEIEVFSYSYAF